MGEQASEMCWFGSLNRKTRTKGGQLVESNRKEKEREREDKTKYRPSGGQNRFYMVDVYALQKWGIEADNNNNDKYECVCRGTSDSHYFNVRIFSFSTFF